jgi:hypothetical protein
MSEHRAHEKGFRSPAAFFNACASRGAPERPELRFVRGDRARRGAKAPGPPNIGAPWATKAKASGLPPPFSMRALRAVRRDDLSYKILALALAILFSVAPGWAAQAGKGPAGGSGEEFFIISSVDTAKKQLLVKEPTEITQILQVNEKTRYTDKSGKAVQFANLRAGDTVYARSIAGPGGRVAVSIRMGPMTVEELHRRYLK